MKFVTVMDMWLLITNLVLLTIIIIYGRRLIKLIARAVRIGEESNARHEREWFLNLLKRERDDLVQMSSMEESKQDYDTAIATCDELMHEVRARIKKKGD